MNSNPRIPKIMIADDDLDDVNLVRRVLATTQPDCEIVHVSNGAELLGRLRADVSEVDRHLPDLILLDLNMPLLTGKEALSQIKADPELRGIPVVVFSSTDDPGEVDVVYGLGANSFFSKPITLQALTETIQVIANYWLHSVQLPNRFNSR